MAFPNLYHDCVFSTQGTDESMTCTVAGSAATITAGLYSHQPWTWSGITDWATVSAFQATVKTVFDAATASTFTVAFNTTTGLYTISRATNFTLSFSSASDLRLRAALGFTGNKSGANSYTSDVRPYYLIVPVVEALTDTTDEYEPDDIAEESVADDGEAFTIARTTSDTYWDWTHAVETKAACFTREAAAAAPWTWQHFFAHARKGLPFVRGPSTGYVHRLRAEGMSFRPSRMTADYDGQWTVRLLTRYLGTVTD